jgi:multiple sugar transport system substrate-binding protein
LAALPAYNGAVHGIVHVDFFRIWKGTQYPTEAFEVLAYLIDEASPTLFQAYNGTGGGMPARATDQIAFFNKKVQQFPWVTNWDVMKAGLGYLDIPSSEGYMPNIDEAMNRIQEFGDLMINNGNLNLEAEITKLQSDLQVIFNK